MRYRGLKLLFYFLILIIFINLIVIIISNNSLKDSLLSKRNSIDAVDEVWLNFWILNCLKKGENFTYSDYIYYPGGFDIIADYGSIFFPTLLIPIQILTSPLFTYNFLFILTFILNGLSIFFLLNFLSKNLIVNFLLTLIFQYNYIFIEDLKTGKIELCFFLSYPI